MAVVLDVVGCALRILYCLLERATNCKQKVRVLMCDKELFPPLIEAYNALSNISKMEYYAIKKIRSERRPPEFFKCMLAALCVVFGIKIPPGGSKLKTHQTERSSSFDAYWDIGVH